MNGRFTIIKYLLLLGPASCLLHLKALNTLQDDRSRGNKEKEELDRAVALSLAEDLNKPNGNIFLLFPPFSTKVLVYGKKLIMQDIGEQSMTKI